MSPITAAVLRDVGQPGRCIACDRPIRRRQRRSGRQREVTCGHPECRRTYHDLRKSKLRELLPELQWAARSVARANERLERAR